MSEQGQTEPQTVRLDEFMIHILSANARDAATGFRGLWESEKERADRATAELELIREEIEGAFAGPYQPSERRIMRALYPSEAVVAARVEALQRKGRTP